MTEAAHCLHVPHHRATAVVAGIAAAVIVATTLHGCGGSSSSSSSSISSSSSVSTPPVDPEVQARLHPKETVVSMACNHVANYTVERRRKWWTQQLWEKCDPYKKRLDGAHGILLHDACLERGVRDIRDADVRASELMMAECEGTVASIPDSNLGEIIDAVLGEHGFCGPRSSTHSLTRKLDEEFYSGAIRNATEQADMFYDSLHNGSLTSKSVEIETLEEPRSKSMVVQEWCTSDTQTDVQHQLRFDVLPPFLRACHAKLVEAKSASLNSSEAIRVQNECLIRGTVGIHTVIQDFEHARMRDCVSMAENETTESLMGVARVIWHLRNRFTDAGADLLFTHFLRRIAHAEQAAQELLENRSAIVAEEEEQAEEVEERHENAHKVAKEGVASHGRQPHHDHHDPSHQHQHHHARSAMSGQQDKYEEIPAPLATDESSTRRWPLLFGGFLVASLIAAVAALAVAGRRTVAKNDVEEPLDASGAE